MAVRRVFFGALLTLLVGCVTASIPESTPVNVVTLDRPVYFLTPEGEPIQAEPGTYAVTEAEKNAVWLSNDAGTAAVRIAAVEQSHEETLPRPAAWSSPETDDHYRIVLLLPDRRGVVAIGSYSGIRTKGSSTAPTLTSQEMRAQLTARLGRASQQSIKPGQSINLAQLKPDTVFQLVDLYHYGPSFSNDPDPYHVQKLQGFFDQNDSTWYLYQWDVKEKGWLYLNTRCKDPNCGQSGPVKHVWKTDLRMSTFSLTWNRIFPDNPGSGGSFQQALGSKPQEYQPETYTEVRLNINGTWVVYQNAEIKANGDIVITLPQDSPVTTFPWTMHLAVDTSKGRTLVSPVMKVDLRPLWSWFEVKLAPIFRHDRCISCHSVGDHNAIVKYHNERGVDLVKEWVSKYPIEPQVPNGCLTCHNSSLTGGDDWRSPKFIQGVNWTNFTPPKQICEKVTGPFIDAKGNMGPPVNLHHHFHYDHRIIWAVSVGKVPKNHPGKPVLFPNNKELFLRAVDYWIELGKPCPKTSVIDGQ